MQAPEAQDVLELPKDQVVQDFLAYVHEILRYQSNIKQEEKDPYAVSGAADRVQKAIHTQFIQEKAWLQEVDRVRQERRQERRQKRSQVTAAFFDIKIIDITNLFVPIVQDLIHTAVALHKGVHRNTMDEAARQSVTENGTVGFIVLAAYVLDMYKSAKQLIQFTKEVVIGQNIKGLSQISFTRDQRLAISQSTAQSAALRAAWEAYVSASGPQATEKLSGLDGDTLGVLRRAVSAFAQVRCRMPPIQALRVQDEQALQDAEFKADEERRARNTVRSLAADIVEEARILCVSHQDRRDPSDVRALGGAADRVTAALEFGAQRTRCAAAFPLLDEDYLEHIDNHIQTAGNDVAQARRVKFSATREVVQETFNTAVELFHRPDYAFVNDKARETATQYGHLGYVLLSAYVHSAAVAAVESAGAIESWWHTVRDNRGASLAVMDASRDDNRQRARFLDRLSHSCQAYASASGREPVEKLSCLDADTLLALRGTVRAFAQAHCDIDLARAHAAQQPDGDGAPEHKQPDPDSDVRTSITRREDGPPASNDMPLTDGLNSGSSEHEVDDKHSPREHRVSDRHAGSLSFRMRFVGALLGMALCGVSMLVLPWLLPSLWGVSAHWATMAAVSVCGGVLAYRALSPHPEMSEALSPPMWRVAGMLVVLCVLSYALSHMLLPAVLHAACHVSLAGSSGLWWSAGAASLSCLGAGSWWLHRGAAGVARQGDTPKGSS